MKALRLLGTYLGVFVLWLVHFLPLKWIGTPSMATMPSPRMSFCWM